MLRRKLPHIPINLYFCFASRLAENLHLIPSVRNVAGARDRLLNGLALGLSKGTVFDFSSLSLLRPLFPRLPAFFLRPPGRSLPPFPVSPSSLHRPVSPAHGPISSPFDSIGFLR